MDLPEAQEQQIPVSSESEERRDVVAQATGVVMAQFGIKSKDALEKLAAVARDEDRAIHDVAAEIVAQNGM